MIEFTHFQSPIGMLSIFALKEGVIKISFSNESFEECKEWCWEHMGIETREGPDLTDEAKIQILKYFSGRRKSLDFHVVHLNTPFRRRVLKAEKNIPYGQTRSYMEVATMVNKPSAFRAVGSANANNPLPLYFPCHRIINSNGQLGGFGGGVEVKRFLLDLESRHF